MTPLCTLYLALTLAASTHVGIPPQLTRAVTRVESNCRATAVGDSVRVVSRAGDTSFVRAKGLMQIMPFWLRTNLRAHCGGDLHDAAVSLCYGSHILRYEYARCRGKWPCALRRYSGNSPGYQLRVIRAMQAERRL